MSGSSSDKAQQAIADYLNEYNESNEGNNILALPFTVLSPTQPTLQATNFQFSNIFSYYHSWKP